MKRLGKFSCAPFGLVQPFHTRVGVREEEERGLELSADEAVDGNGRDFP